jgi:hypothetical protein
MKTPVASARRWKEARRSRAAERDASGGGAPRALRNAGWAVRLGITAFATAVAILFGGSSSVLACPMCFGATDTSMIGGTKLGVLVMVVITLAVQAGFVAFFLYLRKHAKQMRDLELDSEWSELQRASRS